MDEKEKRQLLLLADHYFRNSNYSYAEHILEKVIKLDPNNSKANELLAYVFSNRGDENQSFSLLQLACNQNDCSPEALYYFGSVKLKKGLYQEAIYILKKSIDKAGEYFEVLHDIATSYAQLGESEKSLHYFEKCLKLNAKSFELFFNIGRVLEDLNRAKEALIHYERALSLNPNFSQGWFNKACLLIKFKRFDDAILSLDQVLLYQSDNAEAWFTKGFALYELKSFEQAITHYDQALLLKPDLAEAWSNKGLTLHELKRYEMAIAHQDQAIFLKVDYPKAWLNKGLSLNQLKCHDEAIFHFDKAIYFQHDYAEAWANKGTVLYELRNYIGALEHIEKALNLKSDILWLRGDLLHIKMKVADWQNFHNSLDELITQIQSNQKVIQPFTLLSLSDNAALQKKCAAIYSQDRYPLNLSLGPIPKKPVKEKIRIAYFSPDFKNHAVSYLTAQVFESHNKHNFEIIGISLQKAPKNDDVTKRLKIAFDQFIDAEDMADIEIARLTRSMDIDIAIDLSGHTQHARTGAFSYRLAPIQVNWLGYPGTLGANFIDYILADQIIIPPSNQVLYNEKVAYLPHTFMVDDTNRIPSNRIFTKSEFGLPEDSFVFCCFNNDYKFNEQVIASWSNILRQSPKGILWISENNQQFQINLKKEFKSRGINTDRIIFAKRLDLMADHLARYALADLFLDTFPYNAHTTAIDCLKVGTPLVTLLGQSFPSRVAASLLTAIDLPELITKSSAEYESLVIALANDPKRLSVLRQKLAANALTAPLFNTPLFTRHLESAYQQMYERYHAGLEPDHLFVKAD